MATRPVMRQRGSAKDGSVGELEKFVSFAGTALAYGAGFNANGIAIDKGVSEVDLGGQTVTMGGLLLAGKTLYVARNAAELIVPVRSSEQGTRGAVGTGVTGQQLKFPTTIALDGKRIFAVSSQFDKRSAMQPPELPFDVATIAAPRAPEAAGRSKRDDRRGH